MDPNFHEHLGPKSWAKPSPRLFYLSFPPNRRRNGIRMVGSFRNMVMMIILLPYPYSTTCHSLISPVLRKCHMKTRAMILCVRRLTGTPLEHWAIGGACTTSRQYENNYWDPRSVGHRTSITPFNTHPQWEGWWQETWMAMVVPEHGGAKLDPIKRNGGSRFSPCLDPRPILVLGSGPWPRSNEVTELEKCTRD